MAKQNLRLPLLHSNSCLTSCNPDKGAVNDSDQKTVHWPEFCRSTSSNDLCDVSFPSRNEGSRPGNDYVALAFDDSANLVAAFVIAPQVFLDPRLVLG